MGEEEEERKEGCHQHVRKPTLPPKCPSVDTRRSVTLQQTYYLLFCHFAFSTSNSGARFNFSSGRRLLLTLAEWACPFGEKKMVPFFFPANLPTLKKTQIHSCVSTPLLEAPVLQLIKASLQTEMSAHSSCPTFLESLNSPGDTVRKSVKYSHATHKPQYSPRLSLKSHQKEKDKDT